MLAKPLSGAAAFLPAAFTFAAADAPEDVTARVPAAAQNAADNFAWNTAFEAPVAAYRSWRQWATPARMAPFREAGKSVLRDVKGLAALEAAARTAADVYGTDTDDYYKRFGFDPNTVDRTFAKDLGVRSLGAASDLGARAADIVRPFTGVDVRRFYRDYQE